VVWKPWLRAYRWRHPGGRVAELVIPGAPAGWSPGDARPGRGHEPGLGRCDAREALGGRSRASRGDFSLEAMTRRYEQVLSILLKEGEPKCPESV